MIGTRFGTRVITSISGKTAFYRCDCGHTSSASIDHFRRYPEGTCRRCATRANARVTHGHTRRAGGTRRTPEYCVWEAMLQRLMANHATFAAINVLGYYRWKKLEKSGVLNSSGRG